MPVARLEQGFIIRDPTDEFIFRFEEGLAVFSSAEKAQEYAIQKGLGPVLVKGYGWEALVATFGETYESCIVDRTTGETGYDDELPLIKDWGKGSLSGLKMA